MGAVYNFKLKIARKLIFSKWQAALGGNVRHIIVGASAIQPRLKRVFWAADIRILEGYGLTETSPGISIGMPDAHAARLDYVGPILRDVKVKIAEDGEILVQGPNVMLGHWAKILHIIYLLDQVSILFFDNPPFQFQRWG